MLGGRRVTTGILATLAVVAVAFGAVAAPAAQAADAPAESAPSQAVQASDQSVDEVDVNGQQTGVSDGASSSDADSAGQDSAEGAEAGSDASAATDSNDAADAVVDEAETSSGSADAPPQASGAETASAEESTTVTLTASKTQIDRGQSVTFTATVNPATATGEVRFLNKSQHLGDATEVNAGTAKLTTTELPAGTNTITAEFEPTEDSVGAAATSNTVNVKVIATAQIDDATLTWGVKASFRNYIAGTIANGKITTLGTTRTTTADAYLWSNGIGTAKTDGSQADISFGASNGVHFSGHGGQLDLQLTNPRVVVNSLSAAVLYLDVKSKDMNTGNVTDSKQVRFASILLPGYTESAGVFTWRDAEVTLTAEGAKAFAGFYQAGELLDPLTFSLGLGDAAIIKDATTTTLKASASKVSKGKRVTFTATVAPKVAGSFTFSSGGKTIGTVKTSNGKATLRTTKLPVGTNSVRATFTPNDSETYRTSVSKAVTVTVASANNTGSASNRPPSGSSSVTSAKSAGSLTWSISQRFIAYTTCDNKEAFNLSHCAKGSIRTSGVGSGYLFPQASGSDWNAQTQTGTVNYSGSVSFQGYGQTMFTVTNPSITVTSASRATLTTGNQGTSGAASYSLDLANATKSVDENGAVTFSSVPVLGSLSGGPSGGSSNSLNFDALSFTVGEVSAANFGSTSKGDTEREAYTPAETVPTTTGVTVLTPAEQLKPGGRIEIEASGFEPNDTGVLIVLYSEPNVLDDQATADENGVVRWTGTLPKDVAGEHTITIQGSSVAGAVIKIVEPVADTGEVSAASAQTGAPTAAVVGLPGSSGITLWEWWLIAASLAAIAACTSVLTTRQQRTRG